MVSSLDDDEDSVTLLYIANTEPMVRATIILSRPVNGRHEPGTTLCEAGVDFPITLGECESQ